MKQELRHSMNEIKNGSAYLSAECKTKLEACAPEIQHHVSALKEENFKLQKKITKYQLEENMLRLQIKILEGSDRQEVSLNFNSR